MGINKKNTQADMAEKMKQLTFDYEKVTKEQKDRIVSLREENIELQKKLQSFEDKKLAIAAALMDAEKAGNTIILRAKDHANVILQEAETQRKRSEEKLQEYNLLLEDLSTRCENILKSIDAELGSCRQPFTLGLVSSK